MAFHIHEPDRNIPHAVQEMAEEIANLRNTKNELVRLNARLESDESHNHTRLGELEKLIVELRSKLSAVELKLSRRGKPMPENCRVTMTFVAEFESDDPEVDLAQLEEAAEFDPLDFISMVYSREYDTECDVYTERNL